MLQTTYLIQPEIDMELEKYIGGKSKTELIGELILATSSLPIKDKKETNWKTQYLHIDEKTNQHLKKLAFHSNMSKGEVIRILIEKYIEKKSKK